MTKISTIRKGKIVTLLTIFLFVCWYWVVFCSFHPVYVKIAECFLEEDEIVESDSAVTKAGMVVESIPNPEQHMALILRYKSTYARVLDANRKFLQAASRYHDLSQSSGDLIQAEDLLAMLGRAATCAVLAPSGPQRQRVLGHVSQSRWSTSRLLVETKRAIRH